MITIRANTPCLAPPTWALMQRKLIDVMSEAIPPYLEKYTREDGSIIWRNEYPATRDGLDDFYESFGNWPLFYLLGGSDTVLDLSHKQFDAVTKQMANMGEHSPVYKEYERGYDQFHQSESYLYFYFLCLADPQHTKLIDRASRFAGLYLNEDPDAVNYDSDKKIILAPHTGSKGPRWGYCAVEGQDAPSFDYNPRMVIYGLPLEDVEGITTFDDLKDPVLANRMGQAMEERMGQGDVANNLLVTGLIANAYLLTKNPKYRDWMLDYIDAWVERAKQNDDMLPDNIGLSGEVGEYLGGRWYGAAYGWSWPHGYHNVNAAAVVAANNAFLLTGDINYMELPRRQMDKIIAQGKNALLDDLEMSLKEHITIFTDEEKAVETFVVPFRCRDAGWFDYHPMPLGHPIAIWNITQADEDRQRIQYLRDRSSYDWRRVTSFRNKEDNGHDAPWWCYLNGENPDYPAQILTAAYEQVIRRIEQQRVDNVDLETIHIHHWQNLNPVTTEALVQITLGAPQVIYYGGMLVSRVRYYDAKRRRPGLPQDVAALVETIEPERTVIQLINLNLLQEREVVIQAGGLGEHHFISATYTVCDGEYPGEVGSYATPDTPVHQNTVDIDSQYITVSLPPSTEITIDFAMKRFVHDPSYTYTPFIDDNGDVKD
jgi:hypothetical protein